ncbi:conserved hypothetical protein [Sphingomonas aurantiaca]|uniref:Thioesterase domain-containing protein n=1 Tax=Sphingomonas aurantiaca TaxID=185949 RepID=A0A5E8AKL3_9SPHN|nr:PaaI family thioesterase [Sphingomonas aurantiaca]VVT31444.1 conserved hypothetical protein [Sphingomonas aurantiaca]
MSVLTDVGMVAIPWSAALDVQLVSSGDGVASLRMPWRPDLSDQAGAVATGAVVSLVDHACGAAVMSRLSRPLLISTLNLKVDHVRRPEPGCQVTVWSHCYSLSESRAFVCAEVWDRDPSDIIAAAQGVFSINRPIAE